MVKWKDNLQIMKNPMQQERGVHVLRLHHLQCIGKDKRPIKRFSSLILLINHFLLTQLGVFDLMHILFRQSHSLRIGHVATPQDRNVGCHVLDTTSV